MIYTMDNTVRIGKPIRVFDANDSEIMYPVWCDTKTGEVQELRTDENGGYVIEDNAVVVDTKTYPSPLYVMPSEEPPWKRERCDS